MEIGWTDHVRNEYCIKSRRRGIFYTTKTRKANWIGHTLRREFLLNHIVEGKIGRM
jgi:hypothetical protein